MAKDINLVVKATTSGFDAIVNKIESSMNKINTSLNKLQRQMNTSLANLGDNLGKTMADSLGNSFARNFNASTTKKVKGLSQTLVNQVRRELISSKGINPKDLDMSKMLSMAGISKSTTSFVEQTKQLKSFLNTAKELRAFQKSQSTQTVSKPYKMIQAGNSTMSRYYGAVQRDSNAGNLMGQLRNLNAQSEIEQTRYLEKERAEKIRKVQSAIAKIKMVEEKPYKLTQSSDTSFQRYLNAVKKNNNVGDLMSQLQNLNAQSMLEQTRYLAKKTPISPAIKPVDPMIELRNARIGRENLDKYAAISDKKMGEIGKTKNTGWFGGLFGGGGSGGSGSGGDEKEAGKSLDSLKESVMALGDAFKGLGSSIYAMASSILSKFISMLQLGAGTIAAVTAAIAGSAYMMKEWGQDILLTTERFRGYNIAMLGTLKTQANVDQVMQASMKIAQDLPIGYEQVFSGTKAMTLISPLKTMFKDSKNLEANLKDVWDIVIGLSQIEPEWGIQGALYSLRETLSGDFMSIKRRYEIPVDIMMTADGKPLDSIKKDVPQLLKGLAKNMSDLVPSETLAMTSKQFGPVLQKIQGYFDLLKSKIGEMGFYDSFVTDMKKVQANFGSFVNSWDATIFAKRMSNSFEQAWGVAKSFAFKMTKSFNDIFGTNLSLDTSSITDMIADISEKLVNLFQYVEGFVTSNSMKTGMKKAFDDIKEKVVQVWDILKKVIPDVYNFVSKTTSQLMSLYDTVSGLFSQFASGETILKGLFAAWMLGFGNIKDAIMGIVGITSVLLTDLTTNHDKLRGMASSGAGLKTAFSGIVEASGAFARNMTTAFLAFVAIPNLMAMMLNSAELFDYTALGKAINWMKDKTGMGTPSTAYQYESDRSEISKYAKDPINQALLQNNKINLPNGKIPETLEGMMKFVKSGEGAAFNAYRQTTDSTRITKLNELIGKYINVDLDKAFKSQQDLIKSNEDLAETLRQQLGDSNTDIYKNILNPANVPASMKSIAGFGIAGASDAGNNVGGVMKYVADGFMSVWNKLGSERITDIDGIIKQNNPNSLLYGKGNFISKTANDRGIDPAFLSAILMHESAWGTSKAIKEHNNPSGTMDPNSNWKEHMNFSSIEEGIQYTANNLVKGYFSQGRTSIASIGAKYAPIGAANDPTGLNKDWIPGVSKLYGMFGGSGAIGTGAYSSGSSLDAAKNTIMGAHGEAMQNVTGRSPLVAIKDLDNAITTYNDRITADVKNTKQQIDLSLKGFKSNTAFQDNAGKFWQELAGETTQVGQSFISAQMAEMTSALENLKNTARSSVVSNLLQKIKPQMDKIPEVVAVDLSNTVEAMGNQMSSTNKQIKTLTGVDFSELYKTIVGTAVNTIVAGGTESSVISNTPGLKSAYASASGFTEKDAIDTAAKRSQAYAQLGSEKIKEMYYSLGEYGQQIIKTNDLIAQDIMSNMATLAPLGKFMTISEETKTLFKDVQKYASDFSMSFEDSLQKRIDMLKKQQSMIGPKEQDDSKLNKEVQFLEETLSKIKDLSPFKQWQEDVKKLDTEIANTDYLNPQKLNGIRGKLSLMNRSQKQSYYGKEVAGLEYGTRSSGDALRLGMESATVEFKNWSEQFYDAGKTLVDGLSSTFETGFFDFMSGKLGNLGDMFKSIGRSILNTIGQIVAKMLAISATKVILGIDVNSGGGAGGSSGIGGIGNLLGGLFGGGSSSTTVGGVKGAIAAASGGKMSAAQSAASMVANKAMSSIGTGKIFGAGGSLSKAWGSAKTFMSANPWALPAVAAGAFLSQPGRLFGGTIDKTGPALSEYTDAQSMLTGMNKRRTSDAEKYVFSKNKASMANYQFNAPIYSEWSSGDGIFSKKEKHGGVDWTVMDNSMKGYYKLLQDSAEEDYQNKKKLNELRKDNEYKAIQEEVSMRMDLLDILNSQYAETVRLNQFEKQDDLRDKIYDLKTNIDSLNDSLGEAYKNMLQKILDTGKNIVANTLKIGQMKYIDQSKIGQYNPYDMFGGNTDSSILGQLSAVNTFKKAASSNNLGITIGKDTMDAIFGNLSEFLFKDMVNMDIFNSSTTSNKRGEIQGALDQIYEALFSKATLENAIGQYKYTMDNLFVKKTGIQQAFTAITDFKFQQSLIDSNDKVFGGAQAFADINNQIAEEYQTIANTMQEWVSAGWFDKSILRMQNLSEEMYNGIEKAANEISFRGNLASQFKDFGSWTDLKPIIDQTVAAGGSQQLKTFGEMTSAYSDPFDMYFNMSQEFIVNRLKSADESSSDYFNAQSDLFALMQERAEHLKAKSEDSMKALEDLLDNIDKTMKVRVAEEAKSQKGDIIFMDLRKTEDIASEIARLAKSNDPKAAELIAELKKKLLGVG